MPADPTADLVVSFPLSAPERALVASRLGCDVAIVDVELKKLIVTATTEYLDYIKGERVPQTGGDFRQQRLLLLIKHFYGGRIPSEATVCRLFQVTPSGARALIRNVVSRYSCEIETITRRTLKESLENVRQEGDELLVSLPSSALCEELNRILEIKDGESPPVVRRKDSVSLYVINDSSFKLLCAELGATSDIA